MKKDPYTISAIQSERLAFPFYFISDTHLSTYSDVKQDERLRDVLILLEEVRLSKGTLFVLGDFFDFSFSKGSYIPDRLKPVIELLQTLSEEGIEIHFIAGNHDYWIKGFLSQKIGMRFYPNALDFSFKGKRIFLQHGDGVIYGNKIYPLARKIMRSTWAITLLKLLPIKLIYSLGEKVSHYNRVHDDIPQVSEKYILQMKGYLLSKNAQGYDLAVSGHIHFPVEETKEGSQIAILGDWIHHRTYGHMDEDGFRLMEMESH